MFTKIGQWAVKYRFWIVGAWVLGAVLLFLFAPSLSEVGSMKEADFLPQDSESLRASQLIQQHFPDASTGSAVSLVFYHETGLDDADIAYAGEVSDWLASGTTPFGVESVTSIFVNPLLESRLVSPDGTTMILSANMEKMAFEEGSAGTTEAIRNYLADAPDGLDIYVSGQVGIYADLMDSLAKSIDLTTIVTILLIIVLLLIIYRSPVGALVPLLTIGIAFIVARGVLGIIGSAGVSIWSQLDVFLIVLVFGVGTDYCMFLISRFREELGKGDGHAKAMVRTVGRIGSVITASGFAVIAGLAGMAVAQYQMIQTMGPVMGLSILFTLLAALTLAPAIASIFGKFLFWPRHDNIQPEISREKGFWHRIAALATGKPVIVLIVLLVVLAVPYLALPNMNRSFDQMAELPQDSESVVGFQILGEHYDIGEMDPLTAVIVAPEGSTLTSPEMLGAVTDLSADIRSIDGVVKVQGIVDPEGTGETPAGLTAAGQLAALAESTTSALSGETSDPSQLFSEETAASFTMLGAYLAELPQAFPWVAADTSYMGTVSDLQSIQEAIAQLKEAMATAGPTALQDPAAMLPLQQLFASFGDNLGQLAGSFVRQGNPMYLSPALLAATPETAGLLDLFYSADRQAMQLSIVLDAFPQSGEAMDIVTAIRDAVKDNLEGSALATSEVALGGTSAQMTDVHNVLNRDFNIVMGVVIAVIFIVLVILLRSLVAPVYLLVTVLISYGTTLGLLTWIFQDLLGQGGISFITPITLFALLVALGSDYNIFLMSRVREESQYQPPRQAARLAVIATGGVITACGLILAGTFGVLVITPIRSMAHLGAAVSIGVFIDTFLVRALLVPAVASLLGRWNWWPGHKKS